MKFLMLVTTVADAPKAAPGGLEVDAWVDKYDASGGRVLGDVLEPAAEARVVHVLQDGGDPVVTTGPFAEVSELIAGFDVLEAESMDAAVEIAKEHPMARTGALELRAFKDWGE